MPFQPRLSLSNAVDYRAIPDGMELEHKRLALSQLGQQVDLREEQKMLAERKRVASEKLGALVSQNPKATDQEIYAAGGVELGNEYLKNRAAQIKEDNANNTAQFELLAKKSKMKADLFATVKDQPSYENAIRLSLQNGLTTEEEARQALTVPFNPELGAALQQEARTHLGVAGLLEAELKQAGEARAQAAEARAQAGEQRNAEKFTIEKPGMVADARLKVDTAAGQAPMQPKDRAAIEEAEKDRKLREREAAANRAVTMRGQNMTDARARDLNAITRDNKPPTAAEQRAQGFYGRARAATVDLEKMEGQIENMGKLDQAFLKYAPNMLQSGLEQSYTQAQRAFTEARLRKDSGASIPPHEYDADAKTYFVQPGDTKDTIEQKRRSREVILGGLRREAGRLAGDVDREIDAAKGAGSQPKNDVVEWEKGPDGKPRPKVKK